MARFGAAPLREWRDPGDREADDCGREIRGSSCSLPNLRDAMELYLASMLDDGLEPPEPGAESAGWPVEGRASAA
jgi:hypothetical protein